MKKRLDIDIVLMSILVTPLIIFIFMLWADIIYWCVTGRDFGGFRSW